MSRVSQLIGFERTRDSSKLSLTRTMTDLQKLNKQLSQLIAKSWLTEGKQIREILLTGDSEKIYDLFEDNGINIRQIIGYPVNIEIDWSAFIGCLTEEIGSTSHSWKLIVAYPPRPSEFNLSNQQLMEWIEDDNEENIFPNNPYIPSTF